MARFVAHCAMRWSDMDAYGHINNTAYLAYLEQARVSMFFDRYDASFGGGTVVAHHEISYLKPVIYSPEPLRLELWVQDVRAASFTVRYDVFDATVLVATAATKLVTFDFGCDRPRRLTAEERAVLSAHLDEAGHLAGQASGMSDRIALRRPPQACLPHDAPPKMGPSQAFLPHDAPPKMGPSQASPPDDGGAGHVVVGG